MASGGVKEEHEGVDNDSVAANKNEQEKISPVSKDEVPINYYYRLPRTSSIQLQQNSKLLRSLAQGKRF